MVSPNKFSLVLVQIVLQTLVYELLPFQACFTHKQYCFVFFSLFFCSFVCFSLLIGNRCCCYKAKE